MQRYEFIWKYANIFVTLWRISKNNRMITSFLTDSTAVQQAKQAAEARYGKRPNSPADFAELSLHIKQATGNDISSDTLSRLWGYKKGYAHVRHSVIDTLNNYSHAGEESNYIYHSTLNADDLQPGDKVRIAWLPDRVCTIEYTGNYAWRVAEVQNGKLHAGDTFFCRMLCQGEQLAVDHLRSGEKIYEGYTMGDKNGLTLVEKI